MLKFCGFDLELNVNSVLSRAADAPAVFSATDAAGDRWLIIEGASDPRVLTWICVPASERMVESIADHRAAPADAAHHSCKGWVKVVRVVDGHAVPDERIPCRDLPWPAAAALPSAV